MQSWAVFCQDYRRSLSFPFFTLQNVVRDHINVTPISPLINLLTEGTAEEARRTFINDHKWFWDNRIERFIPRYNPLKAQLRNPRGQSGASVLHAAFFSPQNNISSKPEGAAVSSSSSKLLEKRLKCCSFLFFLRKCHPVLINLPLPH